MKLFISVSQTVQTLMKCLLFATFHLGLHCLPKYLITSTQNKKDYTGKKIFENKNEKSLGYTCVISSDKSSIHTNY